MKKFILSFLFLVCVATTQAQDYSTAAGARIGFFKGISVKQMVTPASGMEGIVNFRWRGYMFIALYEWHFKLSNNSNSLPLFFYVGAGGHIAYYPDLAYRAPDGSFYKDYALPAGIDGVMGFEYVLENPTLTISADAKPYMDFVYKGAEFLDMALTVRYYFK